MDAVNAVNVDTGGMGDTVNGCCECCEFLVQGGGDAVNGHCECCECSYRVVGGMYLVPKGHLPPHALNALNAVNLSAKRSSTSHALNTLNAVNLVETLYLVQKGHLPPTE